MDYEDVVTRVRGLVGKQVVSTLFDESGVPLVVWEGTLSDEEETPGMFLIGAKPFLLDRAEMAEAHPIEPNGVRLRGTDGTTVELQPA